jgi:1-acyl-sn-glycerol-3-phosphate acyltransferase
MKRATLQKIVHFLAYRITRLKFVDTQNLPTEGPVLITTNHLSRIDIPVLLILPTRPDITALITDKYQSYPFFGWFCETAGGIWIDRTKADFTAFKEAFAALKRGQALGISPEGTRSETGMLLEGKAGAALLAYKAEVPITPVALIGTETTGPMWKSLRRPQITCRFGPTFRLPPLDRQHREESLQWATEEIMCRIAALLPESYRGFYKDHPRVNELIRTASG